MINLLDFLNYNSLIVISLVKFANIYGIYKIFIANIMDVLDKKTSMNKTYSSRVLRIKLSTDTLNVYVNSVIKHCLIKYSGLIIRWIIDYWNILFYFNNILVISHGHFHIRFKFYSCNHDNRNANETARCMLIKFQNVPCNNAILQYV